MGLQDRDYWKHNYDKNTHSNNSSKSSPSSSDSKASGPDLSKLRFNSVTGELDIPEVSSKPGVYRRTRSERLNKGSDINVWFWFFCFCVLAGLVSYLLR